MNEISQQIRGELERGAAAHSQAAPGSRARATSSAGRSAAPVATRPTSRSRNRRRSGLRRTKSRGVCRQSRRAVDAAARAVGRGRYADATAGGTTPPRLASPARETTAGRRRLARVVTGRTRRKAVPPLRGVRSKSSPGAPKVVSPMRPTPPGAADRPPHACTPANSRLLQKNWSSEGDNMVVPFVDDAGLGDQSTSSPVLLPNERGSGRDKGAAFVLRSVCRRRLLTAEGCDRRCCEAPGADPPILDRLAGERSRAGGVVGQAAGQRGLGVSEPSSVPTRWRGCTLGGVTEETTLELTLARRGRHGRARLAPPAPRSSVASTPPLTTAAVVVVGRKQASRHGRCCLRTATCRTAKDPPRATRGCGASPRSCTGRSTFRTSTRRRSRTRAPSSTLATRRCTGDRRRGCRCCLARNSAPPSQFGPSLTAARHLSLYFTSPSPEGGV